MHKSGLLGISVERLMREHCETRLHGMVENADQPVSRPPLINPVARRQLAIGWNQTAADYPRNLCVHQLFEAQARKTPDAIAAAFESEQLTYRELDRRANQLANYLRSTGVQPGVMVGVFVERSLDMIVALLGVMKAGGAYVPMDPTYPAERISFVLSDASVPVLLTHESSFKTINIGAARPVFLDTEWTTIARHPSDAPPTTPAPTADDLAYVIYTSGSTGKPKGVEISHRAFVNLLLSMSKKPKLEANDTLLAITTLSFDIAGLELFLPLAVGAKLVIASREAVADGNLLLSRIVSSGATVMQATPVTWRLLIEAGWDGKPALKVLCGGETFPRDLANELVRRARSVWNMYGPTETTIWSSTIEVTAGEGPVPIGPPIDNTQFYVLDAAQRLVPIGVAGELYIGGDGLARGYFHRPELTAEKFVPDPFELNPRSNPSARIYKTGDLVRRTPDGTIEFLGRLDHQVKLRGFRIELGEIETALARYPGVREAVVIVREDIPGDKRLVAYVTGDQQAITVATMREALAGELPNYMLPSAVVRLDAMPLTPNGKIDRQALPAPDTGRAARQKEFAAPCTGQEKTLAAPAHSSYGGAAFSSARPSGAAGAAAAAAPTAVLAHPFEPALGEAEPRRAANPTERKLQKIWKRLLGTGPIGLHENYFELGGTSILAVRLFAQITEEFRRKLPLTVLFEAPTIAQLAKVLQDDSAASDWSPLVAIQPNGSRPPFFCIHGDGGNVLIYRGLSRHLGADQPFYGLQAQGLDGERPCLTTIEEMASLYVREIRRIQLHGPYYLGGYCMGGTVAYEMAQQLKAQGEEVALLALFDTMNWCNIPSDTAWRKLRHLGQKVRFHGKNFLLLNAGEKKKFFAEKIKALRSRSKVWRGMLFGRLLAKESGNKPESLSLAEMWQINERACAVYQAKPYEGIVTDFRPMRQYAKYGPAEGDWSRLALGGHEILTLPVYPAGMLLEPFVKHLADALKTTISRTIR